MVSIGLPIPRPCPCLALRQQIQAWLRRVRHLPGQGNWLRYGDLIPNQPSQNFSDIIYVWTLKRSIFLLFFILVYEPWEYMSGAKPYLFWPCRRRLWAGGKMRPPDRDNQSEKGAQWWTDTFNDESLETGCHLHSLISRKNLFPFFSISLLELGFCHSKPPKFLTNPWSFGYPPKHTRHIRLLFMHIEGAVLSWILYHQSIQTGTIWLKCS